MNTSTLLKTTVLSRVEVHMALPWGFHWFWCAQCAVSQWQNGPVIISHWCLTMKLFSRAKGTCSNFPGYYEHVASHHIPKSCQQDFPTKLKVPDLFSFLQSHLILKIILCLWGAYLTTSHPLVGHKSCSVKLFLSIDCLVLFALIHFSDICWAIWLVCLGHFLVICSTVWSELNCQTNSREKNWCKWG